jgi:hypothetical protein
MRSLDIRGAVALEWLEQSGGCAHRPPTAVVEHDDAVGPGPWEEALVALGQEHQRGGVGVLVGGEEAGVPLAAGEEVVSESRSNAQKLRARCHTASR